MQRLEEAMRLFWQAMKRPQRWAQLMAQAGVDLDRPAAFILHALIGDKPYGWRVQDLADQLGIEAPSVTRKTQELEQAGYLKRQPDPHDGRAISLQVTRKGRTACRKLWQVQRRQIAAVLEQWPDGERHQFIDLFERFSTDLAKQTTPSKPRA